MTRYFKQPYQLLGNRRKGDRLPIEGKVNATWKNQYPNGIFVVSDEPASISADAYLYSSAHRLKAYAAVRHCTPGAGGYRIGFQFRAEPDVWDGF